MLGMRWIISRIGQFPPVYWLCNSKYFHLVFQLVELKNGETYNGHLVSCDNWMNINLREVICTSRVRFITEHTGTSNSFSYVALFTASFTRYYMWHNPVLVFLDLFFSQIKTLWIAEQWVYLGQWECKQTFLGEWPSIVTSHLRQDCRHKVL